MWDIRRVGPAASPLIIHVPHSGVQIPAGERARLLLNDIELAAEIDRMTDWHTDRLASAAVTASGVGAVVFINRLSRLVVDPERFTDDTEPMAAIGMGAVYRVTSDLRPLRPADPSDQRRLLEQWFHPYAAAFTSVVDETLARHGRAVIVDLHSYPSAPLAYELDQDAPRPGVCIGTDQTHTPAHLVSAAADAFAGNTGGVGDNTPFAGTYVPASHWRQTEQVQSIMIEIRRDLYQHEPGGSLHDGTEDVAGRLGRFLEAIRS
jgi:N-formylglutamate amidohydrolase